MSYLEPIFTTKFGSSMSDGFSTNRWYEMSFSWNCSVSKIRHANMFNVFNFSPFAAAHSTSKLPLVISLLSVSPPHRDMAMDGRSVIGSQ